MKLLDEIIFPALLYCGCKIWQFYQGIGLAVYLPADPEPDDSGAEGRTWNTAVYPGAPFPEIDRGWRLAFKWKTLFYKYIKGC